MGRHRFALYRLLMGLVQARDFRQQQVLPLEVPQAEHIEVAAFTPDYPRLFHAVNFPRSEHAEERFGQVKRGRPLLRLLQRVPPRHTPPVPGDLEGWLDAVYTRHYRRLWPHPPATPAHLRATDDLLASLALRGPFAGYLRSVADGTEGDPTAGIAGPGDYVIDMSVLEQYDVKPGLVRPGGIAVFGVDGDRLFTRGVLRDGGLHAPLDASYGRVSRAFLCALNTHETSLVHNAGVHLGYVTPFAVVTTNELPPDHPVRRLLHFTFQTALIGNFQLATFQFVGSDALATQIFSHDHPTMTRMINAHLDGFRIAHLDPEHDLDRRGMRQTPFAQPGRDDVMRFWWVTRRFVEDYLALYYADDAAVDADEALQRWRVALDDMLPAGLADEEGYVGAGSLDRATLARVCATFIHTSTVTHDVLNNMVWNYSTLSYLIPTQVPESGEHQDQRSSFDFLSTLIVTWKPFNMLLDGIALLALDEPARTLMDRYLADLRGLDADVDAAHHDGDPDVTLARNLNFSVTN